MTDFKYENKTYSLKIRVYPSGEYPAEGGLNERIELGQFVAVFVANNVRRGTKEFECTFSL